MWKNVLSIFAVSRLLIACIGYLSNLVIAKGRWFHEFPKPDSLLNLFYKWDSQWYMSIVKHGYYFTPGKESNVSFYPLFPMLVKTLSLVFGNPKLMGFIISNTALFIAAVYLYKLIILDFKDLRIASKAVLFMLISPLSFFFSIFYTEGLFLSLLISSFYYARKKRWLIVAILGCLLSITRKPGVLIILPVLLEYFDIDFKSFKIDLTKIKKDILYFLLIPVGLLGHMTFLYIKFGNPVAMFYSQSAWGRGPSSILTTLRSVSIYTKHYSPFYSVIFVGSVIFSLIIILYLFMPRVRMSYIAFSLVLIYCNLSTGLLESVPRFMSVVFPIYLGMSLLANKNRFLNYTFSLFFVMLLTLFTILFTNGYWMT